MTNKYRQLEPLEPGEPPDKPVQMGMDGGYRGDVSARQVPADATPELSDIRFERTAIRKDFGWTAIGTAAAARILGLIEHKFIDDNLTFHRIVRVTRDGSDFAVLEVWDGANWVTVDTSVVTIKDIYLSMVSAQGCLYIAEGSQILEWCEILELTDHENDFDADNSMAVVGESEEAVVTPGDAASLDYTLSYDVQIFSSPIQDTTIVLEFFHGAVSLGERAFFASTLAVFPVQFLNEAFNFSRVIPDLDVVSIKIKSAEGGSTTRQNNQVITVSAEAPDFEGDKGAPGIPASDDRYTFDFGLSDIVGSVTIAFYIDNGTGFGIHGSQVYTFDDVYEFTITFLDLRDPDARFGIGVIQGTGLLSELTTRVGWNKPNVDFSVHGHNKVDQSEDPAGVFYQTTGAIISSFVALDPAPGGRYLVHFARRLVALQDLGDSQSLAWSVDGVLNDFEGVGSGQSFLVETHSDAIDAIQGGAVLSSNFMALFRARSIWRVFETGNVLLSLGAISWIENLGTNYPFSIRNVRGGVMFLGHDQMVYFLTEGGPTPVGMPIHQDLIETLTGDQTLVDSGWDPTFGEYYLGIPEGAASNITLAWIFDVELFLNDKKIVWRKRPMTLQRFAAFGVSEVE